MRISMDQAKIISIIQQANLLQKSKVECKTLTGGVSSDIFLVSDGVNNLVVKQALKKLLVEDDWYADTARNRIEREFAQYVQQFLPGAVPGVLFVNEEHDFFVMEYLDRSFSNWKEQLLAGNFEIETAQKAAGLMADLHLHSTGNREAAEKFHSNAFFICLRTEPYLVTTGDRHPRFRAVFHNEAKRLENCKEALVHGDFSPKNLMVGPDNIVLLDHEVASYGDPSFDVAFLLNHLHLKQLYHAGHHQKLPDLAGVVWNMYSEKLQEERAGKLESRTGKLLLLLMLARIDGKSPVEYLGEKQKDFVREFVYSMLENEEYLLAEISQAWNDKLKTQFIED
jgi:5-methylthioribose kinase